MTLSRGDTPDKRNEPCSCDSGLKFKKCHGDPSKLAIARHAANEVMNIMIAQTKNERGMTDSAEYLEVLRDPGLVLRKFYNQFGLMLCEDCGTELETRCEKCLKVE